MRTKTRIATICSMMAVSQMVAAAAPTSGAESAVPAEVQNVLGSVAAAYGKLEQLSLVGTLTADIDAAGRKQLETRNFTSSYVKPNFFRHELSGEIMLGCTGRQLFVFQPKLDRFASTDAPGGPGMMNFLPSQMSDILRMQNPSLALALSSNAVSDLTTSVTGAKLGEPQTIDGVSFTSVALAASGGNITLCVNPTTHLLRRVTIDLAGPMTASGVPDVTKALMTIDYTTSTTDTPAPYSSFEFTPPPSARNEGSLAKSGAKELAADPNNAESLVGKAAPEFALKDLEGETVKMSELKGSVVLLDFWATWCGPCVVALPAIDKIYQDHQASGLKVYAVNVDEPKPKVSKFKSDKKLTLPMLLDAGGTTARSYLVSGIPQTVLIGKDGKVRKVLIGFSADEKQALEEAIKKALAE